MTGSGFVGNVIEAYNFIVLNYNPGDQIFCFGFSRGAYTARAVAWLVTDIGIVKPRDMQYVHCSFSFLLCPVMIVPKTE